MAEPRVAQKSPYGITVEEGKRYFWCACGRSESQPFCDGSHAGTAFSPISYVAAATEEVWFCGCKRSNDKPFCDGSHNSI